QAPTRRICSPARSCRPPILITPLGLRFCRPAVTFASEAKTFGRGALEHPHTPPCALIPEGGHATGSPGLGERKTSRHLSRAGFPSAARRSRPPGPRRGWRVPARPGRLGEPQTDCHLFPFCSGRHVSEQTAFAAFS